MNTDKSYRIVRILLAFFISGLLLSGFTAFPLISEVNILEKIMGKGTIVASL